MLDILGIQGETEEVAEHVALPLFFRLIEEALDERDYQKDSKRIKKHSSMRMSTKGKNKKGGAPYSINPPKARSKSAPPGFGGSLEEVLTEEHRISEGIEGETWYFSSDEPSLKDLKPMYLVPSKDTAEMMGKHVLAFKIKPGAKWFDLGADEDLKRILPYNLDTLGYLRDRWADFTYRDIDVVWDIPDYKQGFEKIFVVNPDVLEQVDMELGEISSMAGGSVAGYSMPLGAKRRRGKKKKVYMEPHMHQD